MHGVFRRRRWGTRRVYAFAACVLLLALLVVEFLDAPASVFAASWVMRSLVFALLAWLTRVQLVEPAGRSVSPRQVEVGNHADE